MPDALNKAVSDARRIEWVMLSTLSENHLLSRIGIRIKGGWEGTVPKQGIRTAAGGFIDQNMTSG